MLLHFDEKRSRLSKTTRRFRRVWVQIHSLDEENVAEVSLEHDRARRRHGSDGRAGFFGRGERGRVVGGR